MKCLSINTKSGKPCNNKRENCRWHVVITATIEGTKDTASTDYEPSWWLDGLLLKLFRRKGKK